MDYSANHIQNSANHSNAPSKILQKPSTFRKGFAFDMRGRFVLTSCGTSARIRPAGEQRFIAYPDGLWILDFVIGYSEGTNFFCGTDASGMLQRPTRMAHLYPPHTSHLEKNDNECWVSSVWIIFDSDIAFLRAMTENPRKLGRIHDPDMKIGHRLEALASIASVEGNAGYFQCHSIAFEILSELASATLLPGACGEYSTASESPLPTVTERITRYLESHFREPLSVPVIARDLGISISKISHGFRTEFGETVIKTLQRIRLEQSIPYLLRGTPLKEIAPATGFKNEFYYSKVFRLHYGISPSEWRRRATLQL